MQGRTLLTAPGTGNSPNQSPRRRSAAPICDTHGLAPFGGVLFGCEDDAPAVGRVEYQTNISSHGHTYPLCVHRVRLLELFLPQAWRLRFDCRSSCTDTVHNGCHSRDGNSSQSNGGTTAGWDCCRHCSVSSRSQIFKLRHYPAVTGIAKRRHNRRKSVARLAARGASLDT